MGKDNFEKVKKIHTDITLYELYQENGDDLYKTITALQDAIRGGKEEISARKKSARKKSARNAKKKLYGGGGRMARLATRNHGRKHETMG